MTYKSIKYGKSVQFGRYVSNFRDKLQRLQIPARSIEPSVGFCPKTPHNIPEDNICHLNVHAIKILSIFFLS